MRALVWALFAVIVIVIAFVVIPKIVLLVTNWQRDDDSEW